MKARPILLVIITLVIGFVLGMLTSAQLRIHKMRPMRVYYSGDRFREGFYRTIQPDEAQKAKIDLILDKYAKINSETQAKFRKEFESNLKALSKELDSNLTKDQLARLKEMDKKREEMIRQNRARRENDTTNFRDDRFRDRDGFRRPMNDRPPPQPNQDHVLDSGRSFN
jgi:hypothetical protein